MPSISLGQHLIVFLATLQSTIPQRRIKNGFEVQSAKNYVVYMLKADSAPVNYRGWTCGGAIVSPSFIITAASCVEDVQHVYAIAGYKKFVEYDKIDEDPCTKSKKKKVIFSCVPKNYRFDYNRTEMWAGNDIAVVKVESPYDFTDKTYETLCSYIPAAIPFNIEPKAQLAGIDTMVLGWGHTNFYRKDKEENSYNQGVLRYAPTIILDTEECIKYYQGNDKMPVLIRKYMICTLNSGNLNDKGELIIKSKPDREGCINSREKLTGVIGKQCKGEDDYISEMLDDEGYGDIVVLDDDVRRKGNRRNDKGVTPKTRTENNVEARRNWTENKESRRINRTQNNEDKRKDINKKDTNKNARRYRIADYRAVRKLRKDNNEDNYESNSEDNRGDNVQSNDRYDAEEIVHDHDNGHGLGHDDVNENVQGQDKNNGHDLGHENDNVNENESVQNHNKNNDDGKTVKETHNAHDNDNGQDDNHDDLDDNQDDESNDHDARKGGDGSAETGKGNIVSGYANDLDGVEDTPGICQNDHGGPLVTWVGAHEILIGVATMFKLDVKLQCRGPFLFTSTQCNSAFLDCIISIDNNTETRRRACEESERQGYEIIERRLSWFGHPDGPAENEMIQERPQVPLSAFQRSNH